MTKALGGEASWNMRNVAVDAFGSALGNSIVKEMKYRQETNELNDWLNSKNKEGTTGQTVAIDGGQEETQRVMPAIDLNDPENRRMLQALRNMESGLDELGYKEPGIIGDMLHRSKDQFGSLDQFSLSRELSLFSNSVFNGTKAVAGFAVGIGEFAATSLIDAGKGAFELAKFSLNYHLNMASYALYNAHDAIGLDTSLFAEGAQQFLAQNEMIAEVAANAPEIAKQAGLAMVDDLKGRYDKLNDHVLLGRAFEAGQDRGYLFAAGVSLISGAGAGAKVAIGLVKNFGKALTDLGKGTALKLSKLKTGKAETNNTRTVFTDGEMDINPVREVRSGPSVVRFNSLDEFNEAANNAAPNTRYEYGRYSWTTDDAGRVTQAEGQLTLSPHGRHNASLQTRIGHEGIEGDVGFHLIGDQFDGPINRLNVVRGNGKPMNGLKNLNTGAYKRLENIWRRELRDGNRVNVSIEPSYRTDSVRPDRFRVIYQVNDDNPIQVLLRNQAGQ